MSHASAVSYRRAELAEIHIAKAALAMTEDEYRTMLFALERVNSAAALSQKGREHVIQHMQRLGWKRNAKRSSDPVIRKIRSLWLTLRDAGALRNPSDKAMQAYCKRVTGVDSLTWATQEQRHAVIESLKDWIKRAKHG